MIRLGSLAGYPFEGPRALAGWTPPTAAAVYAVVFKPEPDAIVTVKVIGTAFKPQVFIGRAGADGFASFSLNLPAFSAGTAAIVIEAQSGRGRGELKNLIRRA